MLEKCILIGDVVYERQLLIKFIVNVFGVDTYDILADWDITDQGLWAAKHFKQITRTIRRDVCLDQDHLYVTGYCKPEDWTFWLLKWNKAHA
jgi:hypothetical protein